MFVMLKELGELIESAASGNPPFPPTQVFNETWLVRFIVDWFSRNPAPPSSGQSLKFDLSFAPGARWYSEALLPTAFSTKESKTHGESRTHADAIIGHFTIGISGKADCSLLDNASQLIVIEAKIFSPFSSGVKNAENYDQCARTVACIAELCYKSTQDSGGEQAKFDLQLPDRLAFYLLAPESKIKEGVYTSEIQKKSIKRKVRNRLNEYKKTCRDGYKDRLEKWFEKCFCPLLEQIDICVISWETVIHRIVIDEPDFGKRIRKFYHLCLKFNSRSQVCVSFASVDSEDSLL